MSCCTGSQHQGHHQPAFTGRVSAVLEEDKVELPTGVASFPKEIIRSPRRWCEESYNITHWTTMPKGGHFGAFEQPELFINDLRIFFKTIR